MRQNNVDIIKETPNQKLLYNKKANESALKSLKC